MVVSSDPNIKVCSIVCTFGTNHVYYYGDSVDRLMDPLTTRFRDKDASRLRCSTPENSTVVWVRFVHPSYGVPRFRGSTVVPSTTFRAQMVDTNGAVILLQALDTLRQDFHSQSLIMGWEVAGKLEAHQGSTIRIEGTNGIGPIILRVP